ncbi:phospholipase [Methylosinus sp. R-45379]|jgi:phospholipase/carboxylesterase|uniref:alpha/beta hydrolase n=1 Tax=unclassified Methylosinus TaxID=2624500 RepID=UPI00046767F5|nr:MULTISPECIES: dienelactone hydrolase family protein [unclassified Methylosinus]OAI30141.1 phospholipase [Methylosinus sp. R-45379]TDX64868.1 phospholipase/carboxylesterase [Methylosinus sp. sav-2]
MASQIDGPRIQPKAGKAKQLVVFLHGYGADGNDLIEIGRQWRSFLPDAAFVSPHAPERCALSPNGRQWFPLTMRDPGERWRGVVATRPLLESFLAEELAKNELDESKLALVGFSQGTMLALHVGLRLRRAPAAILGYSGVLVAGSEPPDIPPQFGTKPPSVLLVHGEEDSMIPADALLLSANALAKADVPTQWHLSAGLDHGIDNAGLLHGGLFLARSFGLSVEFGRRGGGAPPR